MRNLICSLTLVVSLFSTSSVSVNSGEVMKPQSESSRIYKNEYSVEQLIETPLVYDTSSIPEQEYTVEELELLAQLTMAEAEGEPVEGQRLVISTVLNRVDSEYFPDTISEVIWQENQFSPMSNGRFERCYVDPEIYDLVLDEVESRSDYETIFFNANQYSCYGTPMFEVGDHYFSSYN